MLVLRGSRGAGREKEQKSQELDSSLQGSSVSPKCKAPDLGGVGPERNGDQIRRNVGADRLLGAGRPDEIAATETGRELLAFRSTCASIRFPQPTPETGRNREETALAAWKPGQGLDEGGVSSLLLPLFS